MRCPNDRTVHRVTLHAVTYPFHSFVMDRMVHEFWHYIQEDIRQSQMRKKTSSDFFLTPYSTSYHIILIEKNLYPFNFNKLEQSFDKQPLDGCRADCN